MTSGPDLWGLESGQEESRILEIFLKEINKFA